MASFAHFRASHDAARSYTVLIFRGVRDMPFEGSNYLVFSILLMGHVGGDIAYAIYYDYYTHHLLAAGLF